MKGPLDTVILQHYTYKQLKEDSNFVNVCKTTSSLTFRLIDNLTAIVYEYYGSYFFISTDF
jgi:hypothetical protein